MAKVYRRHRAADDLLEIWLTLSSDGVRRADAYLDKIEQQLKRCAEHPRMGRSRDELAAGLRSLIVYPYVVFYRPIDEGIDVIRVLHGARDLDAVFQSRDD